MEMTQQDIRKLLNQFFDSVLSYLEQGQLETEIIKPAVSLEELEKIFTLDDPGSVANIKALVDQYLASAVRTGHPHFYNQLFSGFSLYGFMGEVVTALTNSSMYTFEMSPVATLMEKELITKMAKLVGYSAGGGTFVTGGSNGNMLAMLAARYRFAPQSKLKGLSGLSPLVAFISHDAHYSMLKAASQVGIGIEHVRKIPVNGQGQMIAGALEDAILDAQNKGQKPFFVGATSGTTVRGVFDPLEEIGSICSEFDLWFHVDGSWGGSVLLSSAHRDLLAGAELSDSFSWCAHKMMGAPLMCTVALFKTPDILMEINQISGTDYLFHDGQDIQLDLGNISLQCGRRVDALKLWLAWKYYGDEGYEKNIDRLFALAGYAAKKVEQSAQLRLMNDVKSLNICFQIRPENVSADAYNDITVEVRNRMVETGGPMVNYAYINSDLVIRLITANFELRKTHLDSFFDQINKAVDFVLAKK
tara:strand:+ start:3056 stop:4477 length:1422 start_codon:yes stop_codon:yes gene_type:complete